MHQQRQNQSMTSLSRQTLLHRAHPTSSGTRKQHHQHGSTRSISLFNSTSAVGCTQMPPACTPLLLLSAGTILHARAVSPANLSQCLWATWYLGDRGPCLVRAHSCCGAAGKKCGLLSRSVGLRGQGASSHPARCIASGWKAVNQQRHRCQEPMSNDDVNDDVLIVRSAGPAALYFRPCVDCGRMTGSYCETKKQAGHRLWQGGVCLAADRVPSEEWGEGQSTPLCTRCEAVYYACRRVHSCTPPAHQRSD